MRTASYNTPRGRPVDLFYTVNATNGRSSKQNHPNFCFWQKGGTNCVPTAWHCDSQFFCVCGQAKTSHEWRSEASQPHDIHAQLFRSGSRMRHSPQEEAIEALKWPPLLPIRQSHHTMKWMNVVQLIVVWDEHKTVRQSKLEHLSSNQSFLLWKWVIKLHRTYPQLSSEVRGNQAE